MNLLEIFLVHGLLFVIIFIFRLKISGLIMVGIVLGVTDWLFYYRKKRDSTTYNYI